MPIAISRPAQTLVHCAHADSGGNGQRHHAPKWRDPDQNRAACTGKADKRACIRASCLRLRLSGFSA
jgi:hypothetical protein